MGHTTYIIPDCGPHYRQHSTRSPTKWRNTITCGRHRHLNNRPFFNFLSYRSMLTLRQPLLRQWSGSRPRSEPVFVRRRQSLLWVSHEIRASGEIRETFWNLIPAGLRHRNNRSLRKSVSPDEAGGEWLISSQIKLSWDEGRGGGGGGGGAGLGGWGR